MHVYKEKGFWAKFSIIYVDLLNSIFPYQYSSFSATSN